MTSREPIKVRIGLYPFTVKTFTRTNEKYDGVTRYDTLTIEIDDSADDIKTQLLLRHEIVHAILCTQGRAYQEKFGLEEMCEFIAYKLPEINQVMEHITTQWGLDK